MGWRLGGWLVVGQLVGRLSSADSQDGSNQAQRANLFPSLPHPLPLCPPAPLAPPPRFAPGPENEPTLWLRELSHDGPQGAGGFVDTFRLFHPDRSVAQVFSIWDPSCHAPCYALACTYRARGLLHPAGQLCLPAL